MKLVPNKRQFFFQNDQIRVGPVNMVDNMYYVSTELLMSSF